MKGAIFDLDGTLFDSMWVWHRVDVQFLERHDLPRNDDYLKTLGPMGFHRAAEYTQAYYNMSCTVEEIINEWFLQAKEMYDNEVCLKDGAKEYLEKLHREGVRLGIATSNHRELFIGTLTRCGVAELFDAVATTSEVARNKDFPDVYLLAAERLGTEPAETAVFEDIPQGLAGAKAGGFITFGVEDRFSEKERAEVMRMADRYITSFRELL